MRTVLYITYYWPPSGGAGVQRGLKFVKYLPAFDIRPIVITVAAESASYPSLDPSLLADVSPEVRVVRTGSFEPLRWLTSIVGKKAVPHAGFAGSTNTGLLQLAMRWVRGNWMIPDARRGWVKHAVKAATEVIKGEHIDAVIVSSPPHSSQLIGLELKKRFPDMRLIVDMRDLWTDIYYVNKLMRGPSALRRDALLEASVMKAADAVVVVGASMKDTYITRYGAAMERKISVIPNGYDAADVQGILLPARNTDKFVITYVGTMAGSYEPRIIFAAIAALRMKAAKSFELRFVGTIAQDVKDLAKAEGVDDLCTWIAPVPHDEAVREMAAGDMLLLVIPEVEGAGQIIPGKLYEYLAMERPIIGIGPVKSDAAIIMEECDAGRMFERGDVDALAAWIDSVSRTVRSGPGGGKYLRYERKALTGALAQVISGGSR